MVTVVYGDGEGGKGRTLILLGLQYYYKLLLLWLFSGDACCVRAACVLRAASLRAQGPAQGCDLGANKL